MAQHTQHAHMSVSSSSNMSEKVPRVEVMTLTCASGGSGLRSSHSRPKTMVLRSEWAHLRALAPQLYPPLALSFPARVPARAARAASHATRLQHAPLRINSEGLRLRPGPRQQCTAEQGAHLVLRLPTLKEVLVAEGGLVGRLCGRNSEGGTPAGVRSAMLEGRRQGRLLARLKAPCTA